MCEQSELTTAGEGVLEGRRSRGKASIVKLFPLLGEGLRDRVLLEDRPLKLTEGRNAGCQASFIYNYFSKIATKFIIDNSFASMPLCIFASDITSPHPSPCKGEGAACHCEGATHVDMLDNSCQHFSCNSEWTTLPHNYNFNLKRTYRPNVLSPYRLKNKLSSRFTLHSSLKKRAAFTLAEVLITLGILGVVAAMTIPTVVQKYREQVTVTKVKKFYSTFSQAYLMAIAENGTVDSWGLKDSELTEDDEGNSIHTEESLEQVDKFLNVMSKYLKKVEFKKIHNSKGEGGSENIGYVLPDGTRIVGMWLSPSACAGKSPTAYCGDFYVVTDSKPYYREDGTWNTNAFAFQIQQARIEPVGSITNAEADFRNYCLSGKNYARCTRWVLTNGNMDYLHCDDLEWNGKTRCK